MQYAIIKCYNQYSGSRAIVWDLSRPLGSFLALNRGRGVFNHHLKNRLQLVTNPRSASLYESRVPCIAPHTIHMNN